MAVRFPRLGRASSALRFSSRKPQIASRLLQAGRPMSSRAEVSPSASQALPRLFTMGDRIVLDSNVDAGHQKNSSYTVSKYWLRENCRCNDCVNQDTMQRKYNVLENNVDNLQITKIDHTHDGAQVTWSDNHQSVYQWPWLLAATDVLPGRVSWRPKVKPSFWDAKKITPNPPEVPYESVMDSQNPKGMAELTSKLREFGFCFVSSSPHTPEATQTLLETIGPIRNTHYGGFYDFVPDLSLKDTAYTNEALNAHTDTTYFTEPAGLQCFHLLSHTPPPDEQQTSSGSGDDKGGQSILVDGFGAARQMRHDHPDMYDTLRTVPVPWHASGNQGVAISPDTLYPVLEHEGSHLFRVRWNNDDRGAFRIKAASDRWYEAAAKWQSILESKKMQYRFQLEPGRVLIFDNWRVLHGRTAFRGMRRICGAYINRDDFISRWKTSNLSPRDSMIHNVVLRPANQLVKVQ